MVRIEGRKGLFLVSHVDSRSGIAVLTQKAGLRQNLCEEHVPFGLISRVPPETSRLIHTFLQTENAR